MIEVQGLHKSFEGKAVLKNITTTFERGKTNLIIGQSGSGKTVFLKSLIGLITPEQGKIAYDGVCLLELERDEQRELRKAMGMVFQGSALFDSMTVEENVMFPLKMFSQMSLEEMKARVQHCLNRVELTGSEHKLPAELSGGMQKRVGIARAISMNPKYLFCDEPNSGLDPQTAIVIDNLIVDITKEYGMTTVVISHDMNSVIEASDTIHFIHQGEVAWSGNNADMMASSSDTLNDFVYASKLMQRMRNKM